MTDLTTPGEVGAAADNKSVAHAIQKAGGHNGYVVDGVDIASFYQDIDTADINAFEYMSADGLEITLYGGEAFIAGWLCRDRRTTVSIPESSTEIVYVGWNVNAILETDQTPSENENIRIDTEAGFNDDDPKLELYEIETSSSAVESVTDLRRIGREEADGPWPDDFDLSDVEGPLTVTNDEYRSHLRLDRPGVGEWEWTPTSNTDGSLELNYRNASMGVFRFTKHEHIWMETNERWAVESPDQVTIYTQSGDPSDDHSISDGDIWIDTA